MSEAQVQRAVNSQEFMQQASEDARTNASPEQRDTFDQIVNQGGNVRQNLLGRSADELMQTANTAREAATDSLGMNDYLDASDEEKRSVLKLVEAQGEEGDLRRKLLAAKLMSLSE